jgi:hypothetical protein
LDDIHEVKQERVQDPAGVTYYVRAVKLGVSLRRRAEIGQGPQQSASDLAATILADVVVPIVSARRADREDTWKVGVLREGSLLGEKVVHKERLRAGVDPEPRVRELVDRIRMGRLDELRS